MDSLHTAIRLDVITNEAGALELTFKKGEQRVAFEVIQHYVEDKLNELRLEQDRVLQSLTGFRNQNSRLKKYEIMGRQITCRDELVKEAIDTYNKAFEFRATFSTALSTALNLASLTSNIFREFQLAKHRLRALPNYKLFEAKVSKWFADSASLHSSVAERVIQEKSNALTVQWKLEHNGGGSLNPLQRMMLKDAGTRPSKIEPETRMLDIQDLDPVYEEGLAYGKPPAYEDDDTSVQSSRVILPKLFAGREEPEAAGASAASVLRFTPPQFLAGLVGLDRKGGSLPEKGEVDTKASGKSKKHSKKSKKHSKKSKKHSKDGKSKSAPIVRMHAVIHTGSPVFL